MKQNAKTALNTPKRILSFFLTGMSKQKGRGQNSFCVRSACPACGTVDSFQKLLTSCHHVCIAQLITLNLLSTLFRHIFIALRSFTTYTTDLWFKRSNCGTSNGIPSQTSMSFDLLWPNVDTKRHGRSDFKMDIKKKYFLIVLIYLLSCVLPPHSPDCHVSWALIGYTFFSYSPIQELRTLAVACWLLVTRSSLLNITILTNYVGVGDKLVIVFNHIIEELTHCNCLLPINCIQSGS